MGSNIGEQTIPIDPGTDFERIVYPLFIGKEGFGKVMVLMNHRDGRNIFRVLISR